LFPQNGRYISRKTRLSVLREIWQAGSPPAGFSSMLCGLAFTHECKQRGEKLKDACFPETTRLCHWEPRFAIRGPKQQTTTHKRNSNFQASPPCVIIALAQPKAAHQAPYMRAAAETVGELIESNHHRFVRGARLCLVWRTINKTTVRKRPPKNHARQLMCTCQTATRPSLPEKCSISRRFDFRRYR
jgi:hypothetical protein